MKIKIENITIRTFALLMIGVMGMLIANKGLNLHSHKLDNGKIVMHSHPFNKNQDSNPFKSHQHTNIEFLVLENLGILFFLVFLTITLFALIRKKTFYDNNKKGKLKILPYSYPGRAPPLIKF